MTHTGPMPDSAGQFGDFRQPREAVQCPQACAQPDVRYRIWESNDGAYEDINFRCFGCGKQWWVDGIDS